MRACLREYVRAAFLPAACLTVTPLSCLFARFPVCVYARVRQDIDGYGIRGRTKQQTEKQILGVGENGEKRREERRVHVKPLCNYI